MPHASPDFLREQSALVTTSSVASDTGRKLILYDDTLAISSSKGKVLASRNKGKN